MKGRKGSTHQGGSRVPLFFRLPGKIQAGVDIDTLARHYDLFPTLAEFAGAQLPSGYALDGTRNSWERSLDNWKFNTLI